MKEKHFSPCEGCALTEGAAANCEAHNSLKVQLCVLGGIPFFCHDNIDWRNPEMHRATREQLRARGLRVCAGWKREVGDLAKSGYYKRARLIIRGFALNA